MINGKEADKKAVEKPKGYRRKVLRGFAAAGGLLALFSQLPSLMRSAIRPAQPNRRLSANRQLNNGPVEALPAL